MITADERPPFAAAATVTHRADPSGNQDAHRVLTLERDECCGVIVADGVGSWERSGEAANVAVDAARDVLASRGPGALRPAFRAAQEAVGSLGDSDADFVGGTTLLIATVSKPGTVAIGHVGNGAVLHASLVPGSHVAGVPGRSVQWTNLVLPDVVVEHGRCVLSNVLTTRPTRSVEPQLQRHSSCQGSAFVVATDGVWSLDEASTAATDDGRHWLPVPFPLWRTVVAAEWALRARAAGASGLEVPTDPLPALLDGLAADRLLHDDTTVGLVIP